MIVGTAGHIDHGKTALVKALTGTDADRLAEEKARGSGEEKPADARKRGHGKRKKTEGSGSEKNGDEQKAAAKKKVH